MKSLLVLASTEERAIDHLQTGGNVRAARKRTGISLRSLAKTVGIEASTLSRLERGCGEWTRELVKQIEEALETL